MKRTVRSACVAVLLLVALAVAGAPSHAKGPTDVTVSGPGVDARLGFRHDDGPVDLGTLSEAALVTRHWDGSGLAASPRLTADRLGPRYVLTWTVGGSHWAVQHAYPLAEGGAWVRFVSLPSGGRGGWARAPALTAQIAALQEAQEPPVAAVVTAEETAEETAAPDEQRESEPAGRSPYDVVVPAGLLLAVVLGAGVLAWRRRLSR